MKALIATPNSKNYTTLLTLGAWSVKAEENGSWNNNKYSKAYHRKFGGVWEVDSRTVHFSRPWGKGQINKIINLSSWQGDFLAKSIIEAGLSPKKYNAPKAVRLNDAYDAKHIETKRGYKIYSRTLLGVHVDWAIVSPNGVTFHHDSRRELIRGLNKKIQAKVKAKFSKQINWKFVKELGFCDKGIKEFLSITGLNKESAYSPEEVHRAIQRVGYNAVAHFASELNTLAKACGYNWRLQA